MEMAGPIWLGLIAVEFVVLEMLLHRQQRLAFQRLERGILAMIEVKKGESTLYHMRRVNGRVA